MSGTIIPKESNIKLKSNAILIKMEKADSVNWNQLAFKEEKVKIND